MYIVSRRKSVSVPFKPYRPISFTYDDDDDDDDVDDDDDDNDDDDDDDD